MQDLNIVGEEKKVEEKKVEKPSVLGLAFMVGNLLLFTISLVITKEIYRFNPRIGTYEIFTVSTFVQMVFN